MSIWKCLLFWKFWYKVGQCQTRNGEMVAILNLGFCFVPTYCVFSIFGKALPPFKATFLQEIFLRHQSYDISDVRRSQGLQKMVCNNGWCHLPERSCWRKMGMPFFETEEVLKLPTFCVFWEILNTTFPRSMAAVTTFVEAQNAHITVSLEDIKGLWKSVSWSHRIGRPWQEVSHKMEPTSFLGRRKYFFCPKITSLDLGLKLERM